MTERQQDRKTTGKKDNRIMWASWAHGKTYNTWQKDYRSERQQIRNTTDQKDNRRMWARRAHGMTYDTWHDTGHVL